jgi:hypothetical protein
LPIGKGRMPKTSNSSAEVSSGTGALGEAAIGGLSTVVADGCGDQIRAQWDRRNLFRFIHTGPR